MSEEFFQGQLDRQPGDAAARLLLAEFLAEHGDSRASGYLWMACEDVSPQYFRSTRTWDWNDDRDFTLMVAGVIPRELFTLLAGGRRAGVDGYREYPTRRAAEQALCAAIQRFKRLAKFASASSSEPSA